MRPEYVLSICLLSSSLHAAEPEPTLRVAAKSYTASELLKRPEVETIKVKHDPAYGGREMQYQAIAVRTLFDEAALHDDEVVQFRCRDGFVASISKDRITQKGAGRSVAYL